MLVHNVFSPMFTITATSTVEIVSLIMNFLSEYAFACFLWRNIPYINPAIAVLIVYPIKYGPVGNNVAPITSPKTFKRTVHLGPSQTAHNIVGINAKLIFVIGSELDTPSSLEFVVSSDVDDSGFLEPSPVSLDSLSGYSSL